MTNLSELHPAGVRGLCSVPGVACVRHACGLPPIAPGLTGAGLSPRFGPHLPFDGRQRGSIQTERDRYRGGQAHYRMGSAVQDACGLPPIAPGLTGAGLSPRFGPHLPFDGRQRGSMQTERDRYRGGQAHYRMGSAVQDISRRLALAYRIREPFRSDTRW
jgi:hypothetical protein